MNQAIFESVLELFEIGGTDSNTNNSNGRTPLYLIAARGIGREAIRALVNAGADVNACDNE